MDFGRGYLRGEHMKDRVPTYPGRVKLTDEETGVAKFYTLEMADEPTENGTGLNKNLFDYAFAAIGTTAGTATALTLAGDGGFTLTDGATIRFKLHVSSGETPTINVNGTGAKALKTLAGEYIPETPAGTWISATYSSTLDFFVCAAGNAAKPDFIPEYMVGLMGWTPLYSVLTEE